MLRWPEKAAGYPDDNRPSLMFGQNPLIQQTLGYSQSEFHSNINYPSIKNLSVPQAQINIETPQDLNIAYPDH
jgi:hypothetical protein